MHTIHALNRINGWIWERETRSLQDTEQMYQCAKCIAYSFALNMNLPKYTQLFWAPFDPFFWHISIVIAWCEINKDKETTYRWNCLNGKDLLILNTKYNFKNCANSTHEKVYNKFVVTCDCKRQQFSIQHWKWYFFQIGICHVQFELELNVVISISRENEADLIH